MDIEKKRKILLKELDKRFNCKDIEKFEKYDTPGFKRKFLRLLSTPKVYLPYIFWKLLLQSGLIREIKKNLFTGRQIKFKIQKQDECIYAMISSCLLFGSLELKLTNYLIKNLKPSDIFYDIGANYGFYTYLALEFCQEVHSFEPLPDVFENLKLNLEKEPNVFLNNVALSDKNGIMKFYPGKSISGRSTLREEFVVMDSERFLEPIKVRSITLDNYFKLHTPPTLIKMDVEGAESLVIEGGKDFFKNNSPIITMEVWLKDKNREISMEAVNKLLSFGYLPYKITTRGDLEIMAKKEFFSVKEWDNFIFRK